MEVLCLRDKITIQLTQTEVLEFSFLLLHFVSSFPFLIYKSLVRKDVYPVVACKVLSKLYYSREFAVVEHAQAKFISDSSESKLNSDSSAGQERNDFETNLARFSPKIYWND